MTLGNGCSTGYNSGSQQNGPRTAQTAGDPDTADWSDAMSDDTRRVNPRTKPAWNGWDVPPATWEAFAEACKRRTKDRKTATSVPLSRRDARLIFGDDTANRTLFGLPVEVVE